MSRWFDLRIVVVAVAFLAIGFLAADRMTTAAAADPAAPAQDLRGDSFSGSTGTTVVRSDREAFIIVVRDRRVYKLPLSRGGENTQVVPWLILTD